MSTPVSSSFGGDGVKVFDESEYLARIRRVRESMVVRGLDLLLVTAPENMNYLTGYDGWSFYTHQMVILAVGDGLPIWIGRDIDVPCAELTTILPATHLHGYADHYVQSDSRHEMDFIVDFIASRGWGGSSIGVESDNYYFTAKCAERLRAGLSNARFDDATGLVNRVRLVKSPSELSLMREAGVIADMAMSAALEHIAPGRRQCDLAAHIAYRQIAGGPEIGGGVPGGVVMGTGERAIAPHLTWTEYAFEAGDATNIELGGCRRRYHAGLARSIVLGEPRESLRRLAASVIEAMHAALEAIAPGRTCAQVHEAWDWTIRRAGYSKSSRIGYSIGLGYPPDWGEHTASVRPGDETELQPGMTFHLIFGMWDKPDSFVISETVEVTETGHASLSRCPRELLVKRD